MAQEDGNSWWSSWTSGILENVREKTTTALEFVQNDLSEFVNTIQHDTSVVIADSATAVNRNIKIDESEKEATSGKLKQGFSSILTSISTSLHQAADKPTLSENENNSDEQRSTISMMPMYDRTQARLQEMQTNPETYRNDPDKTFETENVSVNSEDTKSRSINVQDENVCENREATSVNVLPFGIAVCKESKHAEIKKESFDEVVRTITSCCETAQNVYDGDDQQKSDEISCSQIAILSEKQVQSEVKVDRPGEGNINTQLSTSKETTLDKLSCLPTVKEPHHEDVKTVATDVERDVTAGARDRNADSGITATLVDGTKETVEKLENNLNQIDVATGEEPKTTSDVVLQLTSDDKLKTINVGNAVQISRQLEIPKTTDINTNIVDQTHFDQPTRHTERERCATADLVKQIVKNELSEVEVRNEGCPLPSSELTCSVKQNTNNVPSSRTTSSQVLNAGSPPGWERPCSGCVDMESVTPAEQVVTNCYIPSTCSDTPSDEDCLKDKSHVEVKQDDVNIAGNKELTEYEKNVDGDTYQSWCKTFDLDAKKGEISELLVNSPEVRRLYTKFVPSVQSHSTFWHRYFYKVYEIERENKRLADIVARASRNDSHDLGWDDEDDEDLNTSTASPTDEDFNTSVRSNVTTDNEPRHEVLLNQETTSVVDQQSRTLPSHEINTKKDCVTMDKNVDSDKQDETEKKDDDHNVKPASIKDEASPRKVEVTNSSVLPGLETKSEGEKSDSSDSSSWIRVLDKEGVSSNSSSSVVVVSEKDKELDSDEQANDDDDDFDFNEDISNEDVEKLVQSITAVELDSEEEDWEDWE